MNARQSCIMGNCITGQTAVWLIAVTAMVTSTKLIYVEPG